MLKARGTLVKAGVHGPTWWEDTPLYFKEISMVGSNAFGFEEVAFDTEEGVLFSVGTHRLIRDPQTFDPNQKLFTFFGDGAGAHQ